MNQTRTVDVVFYVETGDTYVATCSMCGEKIKVPSNHGVGAMKFLCTDHVSQAHTPETLYQYDLYDESVPLALEDLERGRVKSCSPADAERLMGELIDEYGLGADDSSHVMADYLLAAVVRHYGHTTLADAYHSIDKWYA